MSFGDFSANSGTGDSLCLKSLKKHLFSPFIETNGCSNILKRNLFFEQKIIFSDYFLLSNFVLFCTHSFMSHFITLVVSVSENDSCRTVICFYGTLLGSKFRLQGSH